MSAEATSETKKDWVRWVDSGLLISIEVPAHWEAFDNPRFELLLLGPETRGQQPVFTVQKIEVAASDRAILDTIETQILAELKPNKDFRLLNKQSIVLDEIFQANVYRVGYTNATNVRLVQNLLLVSGGKALFQVLMTVTASEAEALQPLIDRVFSSIRFRLRKLAEANAALARNSSGAESK